MNKEKEYITIKTMIKIYCKSEHKTKVGLCEECTELLNYCNLRIEKCPYKPEDKPFCSTCPIHCYKPDMRERIVKVMRSVRIKMLFRHPIMSISHMSKTLKERRKRKKHGRKKTKNNSD